MNFVQPQEVLVVDDDRKIVNLVSMYLKNEGFSVSVAYDGQDALNQALKKQPVLIILDLMLPKIDGKEVCQIIRDKTHTPIIMLTAKTTEEDIIEGLDLGADDYVTKPFSPKELMSRVRALLRRASESIDSKGTILQYGNLTVDLFRKEVQIDGEVVNLTKTEFRILETLGKEPGRIFNRSELIERVFGYEYEGVDRGIDVHIMNLRKKIELNTSQFRYIITVPGMGYRFEDRHA
ncbi:MAG: response regulator transcription factor [Anaerolineaceae bacterium]|nr:response regulator transcription factor [Anaerolineaceae bacterium]